MKKSPIFAQLGTAILGLPGVCHLIALFPTGLKVLTTVIVAGANSRIRTPRGRGRILLTFLLAFGIQQASPQSQPDEYQLKAAFIFHFAQLVEWPREAMGGDRNLWLCIFGDDPFHGDLEITVNRTQIGSRTLRFRHIRQPSEMQSCNLLFIGKAEGGRIPALLAQTQHSPILTVGETDGFLESGGVIRFCLETNKLRFEINRTAADRAGLKISSRLLLLAKSVIQDRGEK